MYQEYTDRPSTDLSVPHQPVHPRFLARPQLLTRV
jgi:hypothetical protein